MALHQVPEYLPTGVRAIEKATLMKSAVGNASVPRASIPHVPRLPRQQEETLARAFPGTEHDLPERNQFQVLGSRGPVVTAFNTYAMEREQFIIVVPARERDCVFQLGQIVRVVDHAEAGGDDPYVIYEIWKVKRSQQHMNRPNVFGRWTRMRDAPDAESRRKRSRFAENRAAVHVADCPVSSVYVWPVQVEFIDTHHDGRRRTAEHVFVPFAAFDFLYLRWGMDLRPIEYAFSQRGLQYVSHLTQSLARSQGSS